MCCLSGSDVAPRHLMHVVNKLLFVSDYKTRGKCWFKSWNELNTLPSLVRLNSCARVCSKDRENAHTHACVCYLSVESQTTTEGLAQASVVELFQPVAWGHEITVQQKNKWSLFCLPRGSPQLQAAKDGRRPPSIFTSKHKQNLKGS